MKRHIFLIFVLIIPLLISSCAFRNVYKLSEQLATIEKSTNIKGEAKIFYAVGRVVTGGEDHYDIGIRKHFSRIKPIYGILEPHLYDEVSFNYWSHFLFSFPITIAYETNLGPHVKIEIVKKDKYYWVSETCYSTPAELNRYLVDLLQESLISPPFLRDELVDDIEKLISKAFKK